MRFYGGLRKHIPITFWTMMFGSRSPSPASASPASSATPRSALPASIRRTRSSRRAGPRARPAPSGSACSSRCSPASTAGAWVFLTFYGKPRWAGSEHIQHAVHDHHGHGHDDHHDSEAEVTDQAPTADEILHGHQPRARRAITRTRAPGSCWCRWCMLTLGAIFAGFVFHGAFIEPSAGEAIGTAPSPSTSI